MTKKKLFIATSTFGKNDNSLIKTLKMNNIYFEINKRGRKLKSKELIYYAKNFTHIIAGTEIYDKTTLKKLNNLKVIYRLGKGLDNIDQNYANKLNIKIYNTSVSLEKAVGELTVGLILNLVRKISIQDHNLKKGIWKKEMGNLLHGKYVGIIGFGKIGKYVSKILKNFGAKILINDLRNIKNKIPLKKLIINSDIITLHSSYVRKNFHLLNKNYLKLLKKNSFIINTSRPELIDNDFLYSLLKKEKIKGAALDVFDQEPYKGNFTKLNNVILTPHIGSYASEIRNQMEKEAVDFIMKN